MEYIFINYSKKIMDAFRSTGNVNTNFLSVFEPFPALVKPILSVLIWICTALLATSAQSQDPKFNPDTYKQLTSRVMTHYLEQNDEQKIKAAAFLLRHLPYHKSENLLWLDENNNNTNFNELAYASYGDALAAFDTLKSKTKLHPQPVEYADIEALNASFLIDNIDRAYEQWQKNSWSQQYNFQTFLEYILPYRSLTEPLQPWREEYCQFFTSTTSNLADPTDPIEICTNIIEKIEDFEYIMFRKEPLPLLGPRQLLFREQGSCPDFANLIVYAARSLGIATTFDFTPFWAASSSSHMWNTVIDKTGKHVAFDNYEFYKPTFDRRLGKVFRATYPVQPSSLASKIDLKFIPEGFLKNKKLIDVTQEYLETHGFDYTYAQPSISGVGFVYVFNKGNWQPTDWANTSPEGHHIRFENLGAEIVYLPGLFVDGAHQLAKTPVVLQKSGATTILKASPRSTFSCTLSRENEMITEYKDNNPLQIVDNTTYTLEYWSGNWITIDDVIAQGDSVTFEKIPGNALYRLTSQDHLEYARIFTIDPKNCKISWY